MNCIKKRRSIYSSVAIFNNAEMRSKSDILCIRDADIYGVKNSSPESYITVYIKGVFHGISTVCNLTSAIRLYIRARIYSAQHFDGI